MGNGDDKNLGQEIQDIVQNAVGSMDFGKLNYEISNTVESAIENVRRNLNIVQEEPDRQKADLSKKEKNYRIIKDEFGRYQKVRTDSEMMKAMERKQTARSTYQPPAQQKKQTPAKRVQHLVDDKPAGRISSVIYSVLGGFFSFSLGIAMIVLLIIGFFTGMYGCFLASGIIAPLFVCSTALLGLGIVQSKRLQRFRQYVKILNGRSYAMLDEFTTTVGKSRAYVRRDVQKMISLRMFPHGRLDNEGSCLILNNETWQQYMALKEQARQQEIEAKEQKRIEQEDPFQHEVNQMLKEGKNYLSQIRAANDAIPGEEISRKLDELELIIRKIFEQLKNHPEKIPEMNKFMDYYLPTTLKLVKAYREFDEQAVAGDNIINGKREIEKTIGTINKAFVNLFDSLFADTAMDISTDISVLQTMLAQEGLTDSDFNMNRE